MDLLLKVKEKLHPVDIYLGGKMLEFNEKILPDILQKVEDCFLGTSYRSLNERYASYVQVLEQAIEYYKAELQKETDSNNNRIDSYKKLIEGFKQISEKWEAAADRWKELYYEEKDKKNGKSSKSI